jgi:putative acetyltransferase
MSAVTIREYRSGDARALWRVYYSAIHDVAAADCSNEQIDAWAPASFDEAKWAERMRGIAPFVAERDGQINGLFSDVSITARPFFEHWGFKVENAQGLTVRGVTPANLRMRKSPITSDWGATHTELGP